MSEAMSGFELFLRAVLWLWIASGLAAWMVLFTVSWIGRNLVPRLYPKEDPPSQAPRVWVMVPARDEERDVEECLRTLLAQRYPDLRVILVDDGSRDETRRIAQDLAEEDSRLQVMEAGPLPDGWVGKTHALHQAWKRASPGHEDLLLFTDADIRFDDRALATAVTEMDEEGLALISLLPRLDTGTFWERLVQPAVATLIGAFSLVSSLRKREKQTRLGAGAFLLVRGQAYREAGGHSAVQDQIVEDIALTTHIFQRGGETRAYHAPDLLWVRMYHGLGELWRGWAKNLFAGHKDRLAWAVCTCSALLLYSTIPPWAALALFWVGEPGLASASLALAGVAVIYRLAGNHRLEQPLWTAFLHSPASGVISLILIHSTLQRRFGGGALWRGRRYPISS